MIQAFFEKLPARTRWLVAAGVSFALVGIGTMVGVGFQYGHSEPRYAALLERYGEVRDERDQLAADAEGHADELATVRQSAADEEQRLVKRLEDREQALQADREGLAEQEEALAAAEAAHASAEESLREREEAFAVSAAGQDVDSDPAPRREAPAADPTTEPEPEPEPEPATGTDPRFGTCREALANGYGNYVQGQDPEYAWYRDADGDGIVCEG